MPPVEERNELALAHADLIDQVVRKGRDPWLEDDLRQEAFVGLLAAAEKYDPNRGRFRGYALGRVRGAVRDYLRKMPHPSSRRMCRRVVIHSGDAEGVDVAAVSTPPVGFDIEQADELDHILRSLSQRSRHVVREYVIGGRLLREIAADLGLTASRTCQILRESMDLLRAA